MCVCVLGGKVIWYSLFFNCIWGLGCGVLTELFAPFYNFVDRWVNIGVYMTILQFQEHKALTVQLIIQFFYQQIFDAHFPPTGILY